MLPKKLKLWSISRKKKIGSQQKHALKNRLWPEQFRSNDSFSLGCNRQMLIKKTKSILGKVCFIYGQLLRPIQCTCCKVCQCSLIDKLVLPRVTGILSILDQLQYL